MTVSICEDVHYFQIQGLDPATHCMNPKKENWKIIKVVVLDQSSEKIEKKVAETLSLATKNTFKFDINGLILSLCNPEVTRD